ncbi:GH12343 [Drosophila grimshawi]|uniref:GH12343 n=1 Tax=Drosophila grimshawi TaxID=7222 RepID=B4JJ36_DROGR|nr:GH12343 [Drosophila grimshawi]
MTRMRASLTTGSLLLCVLLLGKLSNIEAFEEGDACMVKENLPGVCKISSKCEPVLDDYFKTGVLTIDDVPSCGLGPHEEIICCPIAECCGSKTRPSQVQSTKARTTTTTARTVTTTRRTTTVAGRSRNLESDGRVENSDLDVESNYFGIEEMLNIQQNQKPQQPQRQHQQQSPNPKTHEDIQQRPSSSSDIASLSAGDLIHLVNDRLRQQGMKIVPAEQGTEVQLVRERIIPTTMPNFDLDPWAPFRFQKPPTNKTVSNELGNGNAVVFGPETTTLPTNRVFVPDGERPAKRGYCVAELISYITISEDIERTNFLASTDSNIRSPPSHADDVIPHFDVLRHDHPTDNTSLANQLKKDVRILCWVMTNPNNHKLKARHVKRTWGKRCNILLFMSSEADDELPTVKLDVGEGRENLWRKAVIENIKAFVAQRYMSGGVGYVLSCEALRRLVVEGNPISETVINEDIEIGKCMENLNVTAGDSRDINGQGPCHQFQKSKERNGQPLSPHILGGTEVELGTYPHMAAIAFSVVDKIVFSCGGTLISSRHVLTAAHCVSKDLPLYVRLGAVNISGDLDHQDINVTSNVVLHPDYVSSTKYNDIAVLELAKEVTLDVNVSPACLAFDSADPPETAQLYVAGWGIMNLKTKSTSMKLMRAPLNTVPLKECNDSYAKQPSTMRHLPQGVIDSLLCAADTKNSTADACQGDSGGPLILEEDFLNNKYSILGIVNSGVGCVTKTPGLYTRVASYVDWIEQVVWPNNVV